VQQLGAVAAADAQSVQLRVLVGPQLQPGGAGHEVVFARLQYRGAGKSLPAGVLRLQLPADVGRLRSLPSQLPGDFPLWSGQQPQVGIGNATAGPALQPDRPANAAGPAFEAADDAAQPVFAEIADCQHQLVASLLQRPFRQDKFGRG